MPSSPKPVLPPIDTPPPLDIPVLANALDNLNTIRPSRPGELSLRYPIRTDCSRRVQHTTTSSLVSKHSSPLPILSPIRRRPPNLRPFLHPLPQGPFPSPSKSAYSHGICTTLSPRSVPFLSPHSPTPTHTHQGDVQDLLGSVPTSSPELPQPPDEPHSLPIFSPSPEHPYHIIVV